jgi:uncharacterized membrane protein
MNKARLEAFSDGVLAIIITIMVLEIKVPHGSDWGTLGPLIPVFLSYVISFLLIGIYWGNHHHLLYTIKNVNSKIMMANLHLLFWLSILPVATGWMGENHFAPNTIVLYAVITILCGVAYAILQYTVLTSTIHESPLQTALRRQTPKVVLSLVSSLLAIPMAFVHPMISGALFLVQSLIWLIPDRNIEQIIQAGQPEKID